jgi:hypothetical protein
MQHVTSSQFTTINSNYRKQEIVLLISSNCWRSLSVTVDSCLSALTGYLLQ